MASSIRQVCLLSKAVLLLRVRYRKMCNRRLTSELDCLVAPEEELLPVLQHQKSGAALYRRLTGSHLWLGSWALQPSVRQDELLVWHLRRR